VLNAQPPRTGPFLHGGKLIIIGGGTIPDTIYHLFARSIGGKVREVVVIPTATGDDEYIAAGGHLKKFSERGFTNLHTIHTRDRTKADDKAFLESLKRANGLFFGGGDQQRLADAYADTRLHAEMKALLDRGGVIMGTSAGASIMGSLLLGGDHRASPQKPVTLPAGDSYVLIYDRVDWNRQETTWGAVYRPFIMLRQGQRYDLGKHELLK